MLQNSRLISKLIINILMLLVLSQCQLEEKSPVVSTTNQIEDPTLSSTQSASTVLTSPPSPEITQIEVQQNPFTYHHDNCNLINEGSTDGGITDGRIILQAGDYENGTFGLFELSDIKSPATEILVEKNKIAKLRISPDNKWLVYTTQCNYSDPSECPSEQTDEPLGWVIISTDDYEFSRKPWTGSGTYDAFSWEIKESFSDHVNIIQFPVYFYFSDELEGFSILSLPSGDHQDYKFNSTAPDLSTIGYTSISFDPTWSIGLYFAARPENKFILRDFERGTNLWEEKDLIENIWNSGYGVYWPWSPDGSYVALTLSNPKSDKHTQGEIYVIGGADYQSLQITDFSATVDEDYIAIPISWSSDGKKLAFELIAMKSTALYVVDFVDKVYTDLCFSSLSTSQLAVWSPDGQYIATMSANQNIGYDLIIIDVENKDQYHVGLGNLALWDVHGWLPDK